MSIKELLDTYNISQESYFNFVNSSQNSKVDDFGNIVYNKNESSAENFMTKIQLKPYKIDKRLLETYKLDFKFSENISPNNSENSEQTALIKQLESSLESLSVQLERANKVTSTKISENSENVQKLEQLKFDSRKEIVSLRIKLGEGTESEQFSQEFPYNKL